MEIDMREMREKEWGDLSLTEKNHARGLWGEFALNERLNSDIGAVRYGEHEDDHTVFLFDRIHIPSYPGKTTEIDSILVCQKGVFHFEVKSWSGDAVFGERDGNRWFSAKGNKGPGVKSFKTGNPFGQCDYHERFLKKLLPIKVAKKATFGMVLLINASPFSINPGNWEGEDIEDLFTDPSDIVSKVNTMPYLLSGVRVKEIAKDLSAYSFGKEFRSLGLRPSLK